MSTLPSGNDWHEWRRHGIGASDIPAIMGTSPWSSPWKVWAEKVGLLPPAPGTERMELGKDAEAFLGAVFQRRTGLWLVAEQAQVEHATERWMRCTLDGVASDAMPDIGETGVPSDLCLGVVEMKTANTFGWPDGLPAHYVQQVQWQLAVTGMERAWLVVGFAGWKVEIFEIARDDRAIAEMILHADHFWHEHVCTGIEPPVDGSDATREAILDAWPRHQAGKAVDLPAGIVDAWANARSHRLALESIVAQAKTEEQEAANQLLAALQDAELGLVDGEPVVSCRTQTRRVLDRERLERDHPAIAQEYAAETTWRTLRPASKKDRTRKAA